jgi:hypothetical protein
MELSPKPRRQCLHLVKSDVNACAVRKKNEHGECFRATSSLIEQCRALSRKKPARENEMLAEKLDSFATLLALSTLSRRLETSGILASHHSNVNDVPAQPQGGWRLLPSRTGVTQSQCRFRHWCFGMGSTWRQETVIPLKTNRERIPAFQPAVTLKVSHPSSSYWNAQSVVAVPTMYLHQDPSNPKRRPEQQAPRPPGHRVMNEEPVVGLLVDALLPRQSWPHSCTLVSRRHGTGDHELGPFGGGELNMNEVSFMVASKIILEACRTTAMNLSTDVSKRLSSVGQCASERLLSNKTPRAG